MQVAILGCGVVGRGTADLLTANAEALKTVLPKPLTIEDIDFALGSFWLPAELVQKWIAKDLNGKVEIHYDEDSDSWKVDTDYRSRQLLNQYNLDKLDTVELIELILNIGVISIDSKLYELILKCS